VYTGNSIDQLTEVASIQIVDGLQAFGWEIQAGVIYYVAIDLPYEGGLSGNIQSIRGGFS